MAGSAPRAMRQWLARTLTRNWAHRGLLAWALWPLSALYGAATALRRWQFAQGIAETHRIEAARVVVVGNIVAGGAGKTPVVMALVSHLQARGLRVGVISRGYGRATRDCREVRSDSSASDVGDEPILVLHKTQAPVFVGVNRVQAAQALLAQYPQTQVIVSDDGLQHYALQRDLEICVMDDRGLGNGFLLPAGPLREAWPRSAIGSNTSKSTQGTLLWPPIASLLLHTGQRPALETGFTSSRSLAAHAVRADGSRQALADLRGKPLHAVAAIAQPQAFFDMLQAAGLTLASTTALPDHDDFAGWATRPNRETRLICTEKDAVKLWAIDPQALAAPLVLSLEPAFLAAVDRVVDGWNLGLTSNLDRPID